MTKVIFDQYVKHAKDAFQALGVSTALVDAVGSLSESDFPIKEVRRLEQGIKEENTSYRKFLEGDVATKEDVAMLARKVDELKAIQGTSDNKEDTTLSVWKEDE